MTTKPRAPQYTSKDAERRRASAELSLCTCPDCIKACPERAELLTRKKTGTRQRVNTRNIGKL